MKLTETTLTLAFVAFGTASFAGIFDLPAHEPNGFRDTGCDEAQRVEIRNDAGELLYTNNPSCGSVGGGGNHVDFVAAYEAAFPPAKPPVKEAPLK
jgi:hypothetical protein